MPGRDSARSPKSDDEVREAFRALVPVDDRITIRPMFGTVAAFIEGQMFMGLFANDLFVRLDQQQRAELLGSGGELLEPMPGRPMREYVKLPDWRSRPEKVEPWAQRALDYALSLPPKKGR